MADDERDIEAALEARDFARARAAAVLLLPVDLAEHLEQLDEEERAVLFRLLPRTQAADTFEYLSGDVQESLLKALGREHVAAILNDMSPDDRTALLEELPASVTRQLLALLTPDERAVARQLLGYPEESIGRLMTPDFLAIQPDWTVRQALEHIRLHGSDTETLNVLYVSDTDGRLVDDLRVRQLLLADPDQHIRELMDGQFVALKASDDQEIAVRVFAEYDRVAFPVTDTKGILVGIVTVDDVLDVIEEEATEDIHLIGGTGALEHPYMQVRFLPMLRKRTVWLVPLFLGQMLTLNAMGFFSEHIRRAVVLVIFVPLIISSGGNSGSQAATLVIRAMAVGELTLADWWRVLRRELLVGIVLGLLFAGVGLLRIVLGIWGDERLPFLRLVGSPVADWGDVSLAVGLSLIAVVLWGVMIGSMLPFVLRRLGADPASSSTPLVATLVDVTGLVIYFVVATTILYRF